MCEGRATVTVSDDDVVSRRREGVYTARQQRNALGLRVRPCRQRNSRTKGRYVVSNYQTDAWASGPSLLPSSKVRCNLMSAYRYGLPATGVMLSVSHFRQVPYSPLTVPASRTVRSPWRTRGSAPRRWRPTPPAPRGTSRPGRWSVPCRTAPAARPCPPPAGYGTGTVCLQTRGSTWQVVRNDAVHKAAERRLRVVHLMQPPVCRMCILSLPPRVVQKPLHGPCLTLHIAWNTVPQSHRVLRLVHQAPAQHNQAARAGYNCHHSAVVPYTCLPCAVPCRTCMMVLTVSTGMRKMRKVPAAALLASVLTPTWAARYIPVIAEMNPSKTLLR